MEVGEPYTEQMGKYPVFSLTLKYAEQEDYGMAVYIIRSAAGTEFERYRVVVEGQRMPFRPQSTGGISRLRRGRLRRLLWGAPCACLVNVCIKPREKVRELLA